MRESLRGTLRFCRRRRILATFDADHSGGLTAAEMPYVLGETRFNRLDQNRSGELERFELMLMTRFLEAVFLPSDEKAFGVRSFIRNLLPNGLGGR